MRTDQERQACFDQATATFATMPRRVAHAYTAEAAHRLGKIQGWMRPERFRELEAAYWRPGRVVRLKGGAL